MPVALTFACCVGAFIGFIALLPFGWVAAMIGAPFIGAIITVLAGLFAALCRLPEEAQDEQVDLRTKLSH